MKAILLVGGFGTRLRPLTEHRPKALIPLLNRPFISFQLDLLRRAGVTEVVFAAGHRSKDIKKIFPRFRRKNFSLRFAAEPKPLGTGGAIRFAYNHLSKTTDKTEPVLVFNGDVLIDLDIDGFLSAHKRAAAVCSIALTKVDDPSRFGVVKMNRHHGVLKFLEKPKNYRGDAYINAGVYAIQAGLIEKIPKNQVLSIERDIFPAWLQANKPLQGFVVKGYWNDIGTHKTYLQAHKDLLTRKNSWTAKYFFRKRASRSLMFGKKVFIATGARLSGMVCCGDNVSVGKQAILRDAILMKGVTVGQRARISEAIVGENSCIGDFAVLNPGTVLGENTIIPPHTRC